MVGLNKGILHTGVRDALVQPYVVLLVTFFLHCDKNPEKSNLSEEGFISVHGFRGFSPRSAGSILWT
jgi:hypothetical protein